MANLTFPSASHSRPAHRPLLAVALFTLAAALTAAALSGGDLPATSSALAPPAAQTAIPDWHGNSGQVSRAE